MRYAGRVVGEFLELAGFIHAEDDEVYLVSTRAIAEDGDAEVVSKGDGWQSLTSSEVFAFGDEGLQD